MWEYLAGACRKLDNEEFKLHTVARSHGLTSVSDLAKTIEETIESMNAVCFYGPKNPEAYLRNFETLNEWGEAEAIFSQSIGYKDHRSEPYIIWKQLVRSFIASSNKHHVLITDLLPKLVKMNQYDAEMQAALRNRWTYIDFILDSWFRNTREVRCDVPRWLVKANPRDFFER